MSHEPTHHIHAGTSVGPFDQDYAGARRSDCFDPSLRPRPRRGTASEPRHGRQEPRSLHPLLILALAADEFNRTKAGHRKNDSCWEQPIGTGSPNGPRSVHCEHSQDIDDATHRQVVGSNRRATARSPLADTTSISSGAVPGQHGVTRHIQLRFSSFQTVAAMCCCGWSFVAQ